MALGAGGFLEAIAEHRWTSTPLSKLLLMGLAYSKPVQSDKSVEVSEEAQHCYQDECEWRYCPSRREGVEQYLIGNQLDRLQEYRKELWVSNVRFLPFEYSDITELVAKREKDRATLEDIIAQLHCEQKAKDELLGKVVAVGTADRDAEFTNQELC